VTLWLFGCVGSSWVTAVAFLLLDFVVVVVVVVIADKSVTGACDEVWEAQFPVGCVAAIPAAVARLFIAASAVPARDACGVGAGENFLLLTQP
jgi:hypothetical protein